MTDDQIDLFDLAARQFDPPEARARRDAGVALVDANAQQWKDEARRRVLEIVPIGWEGLSEDIRIMVMETGLGEPHSPNCWGSLTLWCVRQGLLEPTGTVENTRDPKSHACYTKRYRRVT